MPLNDRERQIIANLEKELGGARTGRPRLTARVAGRWGAPLAVTAGVLVICVGLLLGLVGAPIYVALGAMPAGIAVLVWGAVQVARARVGRAARLPETTPGRPPG